MKKIILIILVIINANVFAQQEIKEGVMTMKATMSSENEQVNLQLAMMGDMITTTYFKGNKSHSHMKNPMAGENTTIVDADANKMLVLLDNPMLGKKYSENEINVSEEDLKNITITDKGDSKSILDYDCKGFDIVVSKDGVEANMTIYVTDKILVATQNSAMFGSKIKGFPMYMIMNVNQGGMAMKITMEVTEIKGESIDDNKFIMTIPEGYSEMASPK